MCRRKISIKQMENFSVTLAYTQSSILGLLRVPLVVWMWRRLLEIRQMSMSTQIIKYAKFYRLKIVGSFIALVTEASLIVLAMVSLFQPLPIFPSLLLALDLVICCIGWIVEALILFRQHWVRLGGQEKSLTFFWAYCVVSQLVVFVLEVICVDSFNTITLKWYVLSLQAAYSIVTSFLVFVGVTFRPENFASVPLLPHTSFVQIPTGLHAYISKWKVSPADDTRKVSIKYIVSAKNKDQSVKLTRTHEDFVTLESKLNAVYKDEIKSWEFPKRKLPTRNSTPAALQRDLNEYLRILCAYPKKEFLAFLSPDYRPRKGSGISDFETKGSSGDLEELKTNTFVDSALKYWRDLWLHGEVVEVSIKLSSMSFVEALSYSFTVAYGGKYHTVDKELGEVVGLDKKLRQIFADQLLPRFPIDVESEAEVLLSRHSVDKLEEYFKELLNDGDLYCDELYLFFGAEFMKVFAIIGKITKAHYRGDYLETIQFRLEFEFAANVTNYGLDIDESNNIGIVRAFLYH